MVHANASIPLATYYLMWRLAAAALIQPMWLSHFSVNCSFASCISLWRHTFHSDLIQRDFSSVLGSLSVSAAVISLLTEVPVFGWGSTCTGPQRTRLWVVSVPLQIVIWALWAHFSVRLNNLIKLLEMSFLPSFSFESSTYPNGHQRAPLAAQLAASNVCFTDHVSYCTVYDYYTRFKCPVTCCCPIITEA